MTIKTGIELLTSCLFLCASVTFLNTSLNEVKKGEAKEMFTCFVGDTKMPCETLFKMLRDAEESLMWEEELKWQAEEDAKAKQLHNM